MDSGDLGTGLQVVTWLVQVSVGSRAGVVDLECTFDPRGFLEPCHVAGRFHIQLVSQAPLDRVKAGSRLPIVRALCDPETLTYVSNSGGLLAHAPARPRLESFHRGGGALVRQ